MTRLRVLHGFSIDGLKSTAPPARPIDRAVVGAIAVSARPATREYLADLLWGDSGADLPARLHSLAQCLYRLSKTLPGLLVSAPDRTLDLAPDVTADVRLLFDVQKRNQLVASINAPITVLAGIRAPSIEFEQWRDRANAELRRIAYSAIRARVRNAASAGDHSSVISIGLRAALHQPLCEELAATLVQAALQLHGERGGLNWLTEQLDVGGPHAHDAAEALSIAWNALPRRSALKRARNNYTELPFLGRTRELESISKHLIIGQEPLSVRVTGERGIGKTRLVLEVARVVSSEYRPLYVRCYPTQSHLPLSTVAGILRGNLSSADLNKIEKSDSLALAHLSQLRTRVRGRKAGRTTQRAQARAAAIERALSNVMLTVFRDTRPILIIDDAQWLDHASASILARLLRAGEPAIAGVLVVDRADDASTGASALLLQEVDFADHLEIKLTRLDEDVSRQLAIAVTAGLQKEWAGYVEAEGGGNPMFMQELAAAAQRGPDSLVMSPRVSSIVDSRLRELTTTEFRVLEVVAVAGRPVPLSAISAVAKQDDIAVSVACSELEALGLVKRTNDRAEVEPANALVAQRCCDHVPQTMQRYIHFRLADWAEAEGLAHAVVANHLVHARAGVEAVRSCIRAARECFAIGSYENGVYFLESAAKASRGTSRFVGIVWLYCVKLLEIGQLERAFPLLTRARHPNLANLTTYVELVHDLNCGGRSVDELISTAREVYRNVSAWSRTVSMRADVVGTTAELAAYANDSATLNEALVTLEQLARCERDPARAVDQAAMASRLACLSNGLVDAVSLSDLCRELSKRCKDRPTNLRALLAQAAARWWTGHLTESLRLYDDALQRCADSGLTFFSWRVAVERWALITDLGRADDAVRGLVATLRGCSDRERIYALANLGAAAFELANAELLQRAGTDLVGVNAQLGAPWVEAIALSYLGYFELLSGRSGLAADRYEQIVRILNQHRGLALNEPSYVLIFCSRTLEELQGPRIALESLSEWTESLASMSFTARLRLELELGRLSAATGHSNAEAPIVRVLELSETVSAAGLSQAARWTYRQFQRGLPVRWRRFVEATRTPPPTSPFRVA